MKINLEKLKEIELEYKEYDLCMNSIHNMIGLVLNCDTSLQVNPNVLLSLTTLINLGIIEDINIKDLGNKVGVGGVGHLNS